MLKRKKALVTGGARGIGESIAVAFATAGPDVAVLDIADASDSARMVEECGNKVVGSR